MSITKKMALSLEDEVARIIAKDAVSAGKLNVVQYMMPEVSNEVFDLLATFHAWRHGSSPKGEVMLRVAGYMEPFNPRAFPCKSKAQLQYLMYPPVAPTRDPGDTIVVFQGDTEVPTRVKCSAGWTSTFSTLFPGYVGHFSIDRSPLLRDFEGSDQYWQAVAEFNETHIPKLADIVWTLLSE